MIQTLFSVTFLGRLTRKYIRNRWDRFRLKNDGFTIISNHCMGGIMYHDLGKPFLSPTINLKIVPDDFIEFVEHLDYYLDQEIREESSDEKYPVGSLERIGGGKLVLYFVHYDSFLDAVNKWNARKVRINRNKLFFLMTARDGCDYSTLERFNMLPHKNKLCFTLKKYPEFESTHYARLDSGKVLKGYISDIVSVWGKRAYQCNGFDYVKFLNNK